VPAVASGLAATGCVGGSLASSTGPRPPGFQWSTARRQSVHVGETVRFDFVLQDLARRRVNPLGIADYCVLTIDGERLESDADLEGHFPFRYTFDRLAAGKSVQVVATAYQQRRHRDWMKVQGRWLRCESPYDEPDRRVAGDRLTLTAYQSRIAVVLPVAKEQVDPHRGVLRMVRAEGGEVSVGPARAEGRGFSIAPAKGGKASEVRYEPHADELTLQRYVS